MLAALERVFSTECSHTLLKFHKQTNRWSNAWVSVSEVEVSVSEVEVLASEVEPVAAHTRGNEPTAALVEVSKTVENTTTCCTLIQKD